MWLFSKKIDLLTLYLPLWLVWVVLLAMPSDWLAADIPLWGWVVLVLLVDVGHVWTTIFRTYLDGEELQRHRRLLMVAPLFSFVLVFVLAWSSIFWFWRMLAYYAVFHFMKQQYGFLALYLAKAKTLGRPQILNDKWLLYFAMLYPVFYWHLAEGLPFNWFVANDFFDLKYLLPLEQSSINQFLKIMNILYWLLLLAWLVEELKGAKAVHWGKILWVLTTAVNWYGGIVYFRSDLAFTATNVVAHGIPYMVLIIYYQAQKNKNKSPRKAKISYWVKIILPTVLVLAWLEEYLWDMLIYNDRTSFFEAIVPYTFSLLEMPVYQAMAIALLTVPQLTHYIIDGFIWKSNAANPYLKEVFK